MKKKEWTGERLETHIFTETATEHLHRYAIACEYVKNKKVLDIASGEGYGSNILSQYAAYVIGVDISEDTVNLANQKYVKSNLTFKQGSTSLIPIDDNTIDVVISFETIEHHNQHHEMMIEIKRILCPDGILIISTPDKKNYTDTPQYLNPFHIKELYLDEFKSLIKNYFVNANYGYQKMFTGSLIVYENAKNNFLEYGGNYETIHSKLDFAPIYVVCIASDNELPVIKNSIFDSGFMVQKQKETLIKIIQSSWSYKVGNFLLYPLSKIRNFIINK